jgi:hypothetical protein
MVTIEKKQCDLTQHYWNDNGVYQDLYDSMWKSLVPASDSASTMHGELIRCISRLYYDFCNNGNGNAIDVEEDDCSHCNGSGFEYDSDETCEWCDGTCKEDGELFITEYYDDMLSFLEMNMTENQSAKDLRKWMLSEFTLRYSFIDEQMNVYDKVVDAIMYQCLTTQNKSINLTTEA